MSRAIPFVIAPGEQMNRIPVRTLAHCEAIDDPEEIRPAMCVNRAQISIAKGY
jgi:hypothetical protein